MEETVERVTPGTRSWEQYGAEHEQRYEFFKEHYRNNVVIDAACGTGYGTNLIKESGATEATGIDISEEALTYANKHYQKQGLLYKLLDCEKIGDLKVEADLVVSFETLEHLQNPEDFFRQVQSSLKPGGTFICSTPNKDRLSGAGHINPFHPSELTFADFRKLFEKYFTISASYHQSETYEYLRYQEMKHLLHQYDSRMKAFFLSRIELKLRGLLGKKFQPIPYIHDHLDDLQPGDISIKPLHAPKSWHKTFILVGTVKK